MKKVKLTGKLSFDKETITALNKEQMSKIVGGSGTSVSGCCATNGETQTFTAGTDCCTGTLGSYCC